MTMKFGLPSFYGPPKRRKNLKDVSDADVFTRTGHRGLLMAVLALLLTIIVCLIFLCGLLLADSYTALQRWRIASVDSNEPSEDLLTLSDQPGVNYTALLAEIAKDYPSDVVQATYRRLRLVNCAHAERVRILEPVGSGWTKTVYRGRLDDGTPVALKTVSHGGHDVNRCQADGGTVRDCYLRSVRKFLREVWLMLNFRHPNIVKMVGVCLPGDAMKSRHLLASVVELGEPVDLIRLLQMSWDDRLQIFHDLTNLLTFLSQTRLGSMVLDDFRRQQFVLINGRLKLTDLDDLHANRRPCRHYSQCTVAGKFQSNPNAVQQRLEMRARCVDGFCDQWNERMNLHRNFIQFGSFLLSHGNPDRFSPLIETYKENSLKGRLTLPWLRRITSSLVDAYKSGRHLNRTKQATLQTVYKKIVNTDASPADSLWCVQRYGCRLTVFDIAEAENVCSANKDCTGFVLSKEKSWLNHSIVYLKTKQSRANPHLGHTLYLKPS